LEPSGRLELTWTNKHLRLITTEQDGYAWVEPGDPRVSEVRLLHEVETVGVEEGDGPPNLLIEGDALHALTALNRIPELAQKYAGKVRLVYIDPPFNTGQAFAHYDDNLEHSVWLSMLRDRLVQLKPLLASNGSIWVHLDDAEVHRCRVVMDEVLGSGLFAGSVSWRSADTGNYDAKRFSEDHNTILVYGASTDWKANRVGRSAAQASHYANPDGDPRGPWFDGNPLGSPNHRDNLKYDVESPTGFTIKHPPHGWRWSRETLAQKLETGDVRFSEDGTRLIYRTYLWEQGGLPPSTLWASVEETGSNRKAKNELKALFGLPSKEVFATPKPERLMKRIMEIATDHGDLVLDCFGGSGTTAAVAHKLGRRWVTIEREADTVARFTLPRMKMVVSGEDSGGISSRKVLVDDELPGGVRSGESRAAAKVLEGLYEAGRLAGCDLDEDQVDRIARAMRRVDRVRTELVWTGGGGFRRVRVGPSMFDLDAETGEVFLAEWATNGAFSTAVAAQLGFELVDEPPFCGFKGRTRLAVLDGVVGAAEVEFLVAALGERERAVVVGKAVTEDAEPLLRRLSPGSRLRFAPDDLVRLGGRR
jgi:adenine-specific DNA-methyltransferase